MSDNDKKLEAINNGLKTIEFIQKNRDSIIRTYGRSAISDPKTKDRTKAWEEFINHTTTNNGGSQRGTESPEGNSSRKSSIHPENVEKMSSESSHTKGDNNKPDDCGNHTNRNADHVVGPDEERGAESGQCLADNSRLKHSNTNGRTESASSSKDNGRSCTRVGSENGERPDSKTTETIKREQGERSVKETTQGDLDEILQETDLMPSKKLKNSSKIQQLTGTIKSENHKVKKTTEENSSSTKKKTKLPSKAGAIPSALLSDQNQPAIHAAVENVQINANNAPTTSAEGNDSKIPETMISNFDILEKKIDQLLENQEKILTKLTMISEIKEEISGIKKSLTNQSLAISTVEKYISEMMIIIPKSGQPDQMEGKDINPDLKMVIGRDQTRGYKDMSKKYDQRDKIDISDDIYIPREIDETYILKDIDNTKNNAANFIPTNDSVSYQIIRDIINKEVKMPEVAEELHQLVDDSIGKIDANELYTMITTMLN